MKKNIPQPVSNDSGRIELFYLGQLENLYCIYTHLAERFSELVDSPSFTDLKVPINEMVYEFSIWADRLETIYTLITGTKHLKIQQGLLLCLEEAFAPIYSPNIVPALRNTFVISYLYYHQSLNIAVSHILQNIPKTIFEPIAWQMMSEMLEKEAKKNNPLLQKLINEQKMDFGKELGDNLY